MYAFKYFVYFMCVSVSPKYLSVYHGHAVFIEARRGHHIPWDWS